MTAAVPTDPSEGTEPVARPPVRPLLLGMNWFGDRPGGLSRYFRDLLVALADAGTGARAVVVGPAPAAPPEVVPAGRGGWPLPLRMAVFARAATRAGRDVNVVDAHFALYALLPVTLTRLRRLPLVVHFHGPWTDEGRVSASDGAGTSAYKRAVERAVYRRAEMFIVLSHAFRTVLVERYGVAPWRVQVVAPTVDLDHFRPGDQLAARRRLGLPEGSFVAVVARRLEPRMGLEVLVDAWSHVVSERPDALLVVVGAGQLGEALEGRARELGLSQSVVFRGRVSDDDLAAAFQAADVSVVPTVELEGFGLVVLESLATGTPVVLTDVGGLPETVVGLEGAGVIAANDPVGLAAAVLDIAAGGGSSPEACRAHAESFSSAALADRHLELYAAAADGSAAHRPRILFVDHCALRSGAELALARLLPFLDVDAHVVLGEDGPLVELLRSQGTSCEVLALSGAVTDVRKDDVRAGRLPLAGVVGAGRSVLALRRRIRQLQPDIVHTNSLKAALYGGVAAKLAGVPVVWHLRDRIASDYLPGGAVRLVRFLASRLPDAIIANSAATLATAGEVTVPTSVVPSPVPMPPPAPDRPPGGDLVVGMVGRLAAWKGQDVFLAAFARAFPEGGARAILVGGALFGEDDFEAQLHELAEGPALAGRVELTGHLDEVVGQLQRFDVLVHASVVAEPFGQVVVEGMAAGLPVIASAAGGPAEIITHGVDGLLHTPGDVAELAALLSSLAADPALRSSLGVAGRRRAADYAPEHVAAAVLDVYRVVSGRA